MNITSTLQLLFHANQLKRTARTGWVQRGVPNSEDVAAHSFGVVFTTMILAQNVPEPINLERALAMAALHDLPEALISDIPLPAQRFLPDGGKAAAERMALQEMMGELSFGQAWIDLWEEMHEKETAVARLVDDADKLELHLQAYVYELQTGNQQLDVFWQRPFQFHYAETQALYEALVQWRQEKRTLAE